MGKKTISKSGGGPPACAILPYLYLGPRTSASSDFITRNDITDVLSVGATPMATGLPRITYHRLSLSDEVTSEIRRASDEADSIINKVKTTPGRKILVHCSAAISRSPTLVAAYLMKTRGMSLYHALGLVVRSRPSACPNSGFLRQLKELELELSSTATVDIDELPRKKQDRLEFFSSAILS